MNRSCLLLGALLLGAACHSTPDEAPGPPPARAPLVPPRIPGAAPARSTASGAPEGRFEGRVAETMDAGPYTYARVESGGSSAWVAAPTFTASAGELVRFSTAMPMANYRSETLDRSFDVVYFAEAIERLDGGAGLPPGHPSLEARPSSPEEGHGSPTAASAPAADLVGIEPPEGGLDVASIHARAGELAGTSVKVRGRVVKFTGGVMGHNWLHLQDGSGEGDSADLTVVTDGLASVGDLVSAEGLVATDQDFGFGYQYAVLLQDATLRVE